MRKTLTTISLLAAAWALTACGEKPQEVTGARSDKPVQAGTGVAVFTDAGWTAGDKASWANHLKARANYGMTDHQRAPK